MKRSDRVETVVRVRKIQKRLAETQTVRRRIDADERRHDADRAGAILAEHCANGPGGALTSTELARRRTVVQAAATAVERTVERVDRAEEALAVATDVWHGAHRSHEAVDRLLDRTLAAEDVGETRRARSELDDIVSTRHGRRVEEERP